ncbi:MAG: glycosyltransferase [bacterium]
MKKILLVSKFTQDKQTYTYASSFYHALQNLGHRVIPFNCKQSFLPVTGFDHDGLPYTLKVINNVLINNALKRLVALFRPDIIFLIKGENISHKTIRVIKSVSNCFIMNFYPDNPFVFWNGNSNKNVLLSLPVYDVFLSWSKMMIPVLESVGCKNVLHFPFAYDQTIFNQNIVISEQEYRHYASDVCFVGTWDRQREEWLSALCEQMPGLILAIWGNDWDKNLPRKSLLREKIRGKAIYKEAMVKAFLSSKIVLNFIRQQNKTSHNMRSFEVLASKAFLLTQRTAEQTEFPFLEGQTLECFETVEELTKKIAIYLKNDTLREKIAHEGYVAVQDYTISNQLKTLFAYLKIREKGEYDGEQKTKNCDFIDTQSI